MDAVPSRSLVGDESDDGALPLLFELKNVSHRLVFRDVVGPKAGTHLIEERVERFAFERAVQLGAVGGLTRAPKRHGGNPFPVAVVPQIDKHERVRFQFAFHFFHALHNHSPLHFLGRDGEQFDGFNHIVAKPSVETFFNLSSLAHGTLRKRAVNVLAYHLSPIPHHIIDDGVTNIGQCIKHTQRQM